MNNTRSDNPKLQDNSSTCTITKRFPIRLHEMLCDVEAKGYSDSWIEKRIRGIQVRDELTNEWKTRGVKEGKEMYRSGILELKKNNKKCVKNILF